MTSEQLNSALQAEYLQLQKTIEDFDSRALTIKAWSVTFGLVAILGAFASHSKISFLISAASASIFWILEIQWKLFQLSYHERSLKIEAHFRGESIIQHPFQIGTSWYQAWLKTSFIKFLSVAMWLHVVLPHALVLISGIVLFILSCAQLIIP